MFDFLPLVHPYPTFNFEDNPMTECSDDERLRDLASQAFDAGRLLDALKAIDPILASGSAKVEDWLFTGQVLIQVREYAQAVKVLRTGLQLQSDHIELQYELAIALFQLGDVSTATLIFERLAREAGLFQAWSSLATVLPGCPDADHARVLRLRKEFSAELQKQPSGKSHNNEHCISANQAASQAGNTPARSQRRIRLGYISAFFHRSNYMKPVWGLINGHDRSNFQIELFADDCQPDQFEWLQASQEDRVHITSDMDNERLGNLIRERSLDIVIDLNAYSVVPRIGLYTQRLAPVVVAWFNMYATSALPGIDWIVGDQYVLRTEEEAFYTERVFRLPHSYLGFVVGHQAPDVVPPPCLSDALFTFGSLVSQYKITPAVIDAWSQILRRVEKSRLLLANRAMQSSMNREYMIAEFARRGIAADRLRLLPPADHYAYLEYYNQIDLALDAFPYNGGTTTTEAIWQGVPVLAFDGDRWAARTSRTLLMNCHLKEFVAPNEHAWIELAVQWGTNPASRERLRTIRASMREELKRSDVCCMPTMVQAIEDFYRSCLW